MADPATAVPPPIIPQAIPVAIIRDIPAVIPPGIIRRLILPLILVMAVPPDTIITKGVRLPAITTIIMTTTNMGTAGIGIMRRVPLLPPFRSRIRPLRNNAWTRSTAAWKGMTTNCNKA